MALQQPYDCTNQRNKRQCQNEKVYHGNRHTLYFESVVNITLHSTS
nr:hypothetical protein [Vibrio parahaemolyticus]